MSIRLDLAVIVPSLAERIARDGNDTTRRPELVGDLMEAAHAANKQGRPYLAAVISNARRAVERGERAQAEEQIAHAARMLCTAPTPAA